LVSVSFAHHGGLANRRSEINLVVSKERRGLRALGKLKAKWGINEKQVYGQLHEETVNLRRRRQNLRDAGVNQGRMTSERGGMRSPNKQRVQIQEALVKRERWRTGVVGIIGDQGWR